MGDQNTRNRIEILKKIKQRLSDMYADIESGKRTTQSIPFTKSDMDKFLIDMTNTQSAIPQLINDSGSNSALNNLFPNYAAGDVKGAELAKDMFDKYSDDFFKNVSWDITVKHKGAAERQIAKNYANAMSDAKSAAADASMGGSNTYGPAAVGGAQPSYGGFLDSVVKSLSSSMDAPATAGTTAATTAAHTKASGTPSKFDWKQRSVQICAQISARGMDPNDFGCLANPDSMRQESFSWRGHTRMVCNRLNTVYDTSIPFLCGCPPPTWPGWKQ